MKIAVASEDGVGISHHFGRSRCFLIFETEDKRITGQSSRKTLSPPTLAASATRHNRTSTITATGRSSRRWAIARSCSATAWVGGPPKI